MTDNSSISVPIFIESRYRVNRKRIKRVVVDTLIKNGSGGPAEVSVAIVGDRKMRSLNKKYRGLDKTTNVLSFSQTEGERQAFPPTTTVFLGDVVVSYPKVIEEASFEKMLVDDKVCELVEHGVLHLLGKHHL